MHLSCGRGDIAVRKSRELLMSGRWRRKGGDDIACERRRRGQRERLAPHKGHWRGRALRLLRRAKEVKRNCTEGSGDGAAGGTGDGGSGCASRSACATAASKPSRGPWMRFDIACKGGQVEVEGPMLRCERAEEGSNIG
eukprot:5483088-Pleurochrysis_carterae.AAC.1